MKYCMGSCLTHRGKVRRVVTRSLDAQPFHCREAWYCQSAVDADRKAGYRVIITDTEFGQVAFWLALAVCALFLIFAMGGAR